jgi:hypothetical protein
MVNIDSITEIDALLSQALAMTGFNGNDIQEILDGKNLRQHQSTIDQGAYLDNFLALLGWCNSIAHMVLSPNREVLFQSAANCEHWGIASRLREMFDLYLIAFASRYEIDDFGSDPTELELIRRFYGFKQHIAALVKEDCPDADLSPLLAHA